MALTVDQAETIYQESRRTIYRKVKELNIPSKKENGVNVYDEAILDQYFKRKDKIDSLAKVVCFANQKGGIGKTTTCLNAGISLSNYNKKRVLLIDFDPQANLTSQFAEPAGIAETIGDALGLKNYGFKSSSFERVVISKNGIDIIPSNIRLQRFNMPLGIDAIDAFDKLGKFIKNLKGRYDYILIDCPPTLDIKLLNALKCSDIVIIPVTPAAFSVQGMDDLFETIEKVKETGSNLKSYILINKYNERRQLSTLKDEIYGSSEVLETIIPDRTDIEKAQALPEHIDAVNHKIFKIYNKLTDEIIKL